MAIDTSPEGLASELNLAIEARNRYIDDEYRESIRRFYGPAYRKGGTRPTNIDFENHAHAWISTFLPILASGNPRVRGRTPRLGSAAVLSKAVELAVNRNFELTDVKRTIEQLATDWAFKYCVAFTSAVPVPGMTEREDPLQRPATKRLSLEDYIFDPAAQQHAECRLQGHRLRRDRDSLMDEAEDFPERGWNKSAIIGLNADKGRERKGLPRDIERDEVEFYEILVHEKTLDDAKDANGKAFKPRPERGFHGTIYTIAEETNEYLRAPRPFWGPQDGPYTFSSYLYIPDEVVGLAPLVATAVQADEFNRSLAASIEAIRRYKRGFAVSSESGELAEKIAEFEDLGVFSVDALGDLDKNLRALEAGGISQQHLQHLETLRYLLERASGLSPEQMGAISQDATATQSSIAQMSSNRRMGYMTEKFIQTVVKPIAKKEAWYLVAHPESRISLGDLAEGLFMDPKTGQPIEMPVLEGGPDNVELLEGNDIEIQPISMRFTTEMLEAERSASWEQFLLTTAPMIPSLPYVDWGLVFSRKAEELGDPSLARTIDLQKAMFMGMLQMQMQLGQPMPQLMTQPTQSQPRLGIDLKSRTPALKSSERPSGFTANARPGGNGQAQKGPRTAGTSASTKG